MTERKETSRYDLQSVIGAIRTLNSPPDWSNLPENNRRRLGAEKVIRGYELVHPEHSEKITGALDPLYSGSVLMGDGSPMYTDEGGHTHRLSPFEGSTGLTNQDKRPGGLRDRE